MDAKQALADLTEISSQIRSAVLLAEDGAVAASTLDDERAGQMAEAARALLEAAERTRPSLGPGALTQLEVATLTGSVFVVRDHGRVITAITGPEPTVGLVFYDLKTCLRNAADPGPAAPKSARKPATKKPAEGKAASKAPRKSPTRKKDDAAS
jgi:predicted regulator of Ras-like GTPase activity (Roadblock/LC7/MglB family)